MGLKKHTVYKDDSVRMCAGDSRAVLTEIKDETIDVVWTDPPYGLPMTHKGEFGFHLNDDWKTTDASEVLVSVLEQCARVMTPNAEIFCMTAGPAFGDTYATLQRLGFGTLRTLTWDKGSAPPTFPGFAWKNCTELIIYGTRKVDQSWKTQGGTNSVIRQNRCAGKERILGPDGKAAHPTQKPIGLIRQCLANARPGLVLDPFAGVGSTLVAGALEGRKVIGVEFDPTFAAAAAARLTEEAPTWQVS